MLKFTLSKAIGRDNFSIVAGTEEADDACDGIETVEAAEQMDEAEDVIDRSAYSTSWLLTDGSETAAAVMLDDGSWAKEWWSRALSGGTLLLGGGSMA